MEMLWVMCVDLFGRVISSMLLRSGKKMEIERRGMVGLFFFRRILVRLVVLL